LAGALTTAPPLCILSTGEKIGKMAVAIFPTLWLCGRTGLAGRVLLGVEGSSGVASETDGHLQCPQQIVDVERLEHHPDGLRCQLALQLTGQLDRTGADNDRDRPRRLVHLHLLEQLPPDRLVPDHEVQDHDVGIDRDKLIEISWSEGGEDHIEVLFLQDIPEEVEDFLRIVHDQRQWALPSGFRRDL
jgi:hypothetical protein